jgi:hypothetical protein
MPEPISVDSELLNSEQFQEFIGRLRSALNTYRTGVSAATPLGEPRTDVDRHLQNLLTQGLPYGERLLQVMASLSSGDSRTVDELRALLERAEADNIDAANWTPGAPRHTV